MPDGSRETLGENLQQHALCPHSRIRRAIVERDFRCVVPCHLVKLYNSIVSLRLIVNTIHCRVSPRRISHTLLRVVRKLQFYSTTA